MTTTLNHLTESRAQLAEASRLADAGSPALARTHLLSAADHALIALAARSAVEVSPARPQLDRLTIAMWLAAVGAAPQDVAPVLRDLDNASADYMHDPALAARLTAGFGLVHALIDASLANPASPSPRGIPAQMPLYGGARGALNARGAEAAARGLSRLAAAARPTVRRKAKWSRSWVRARTGRVSGGEGGGLVHVRAAGVPGSEVAQRALALVLVLDRLALPA